MLPPPVRPPDDVAGAGRTPPPVDEEQSYRELFESSPRPMWVYDVETLRFLTVNESAVRAYGYSRDEFLAMTIADVRPLEDVPAMTRMVRAMGAGFNPSGFWRHRRRDGSLMDVEITSHSIDFGGRPARLVLVSDVTAQRAAEAALQASEAELRAVFAAMTDVVLVFDADARYVKIAPTSPELLYRPTEALLGRRAREIFAPALAEYFESVVRQALDGDAPVHFDYELEIGGEPRWFSGTASPMRPAGAGTSGGGGRVLWVARDVTASKQLEAQLRQAQKMEAVGLLAGGIAHDFNNLLTVITAYGQLLRVEFADGDERREEVEEVLKAAARGAELTRQLLAFGRKQVLRPRVLDVNGVVAGVRPMLARLLGADATLDTRLAPSLSRVEADPGQLEQVLLNLTANAGDAMPGGGRVTIETADVELDAAAVRALPGLAPGRYVLVSVSDTGVGMDEATRLRVFEPFFTTKGTGKGSGLGLATVYGIVKQSGGAVTVRSAPGEGTTFEIYLPRAAREGGRDAGAAPPAPAARPTVLLVDDDDAVRSSARRALEGGGYEVLEAAHGAQALDVFAEHGGRVRLLVTDVVMPGLGGHALAERLRAQRAGLPVLFMSGYAVPDEPGGGPAVAPLLAKPFTAEELLAAVGEAAGAAAR